MMADNSYTEMTKQHEGLRLKVYKDQFGKKTIGYGHNMSARKENMKTITRPQANNMFSTDYVEAEDRAAKIVGPKYDALHPDHQAILNDMSFQLGDKLGDFKNMIAAIKDDRLDEVSQHMLDSDWAKQTPGRAIELADKWDAAISRSSDPVSPEGQL